MSVLIAMSYMGDGIHVYFFNVILLIDHSLRNTIIYLLWTRGNVTYILFPNAILTIIRTWLLRRQAGRIIDMLCWRLVIIRCCLFRVRWEWKLLLNLLSIRLLNLYCFIACLEHPVINSLVVGWLSLVGTLKPLWYHFEKVLWSLFMVHFPVCLPPTTPIEFPENELMKSPEKDKLSVIRTIDSSSMNINELPMAPTEN